jgi:hypothetical protein
MLQEVVDFVINMFQIFFYPDMFRHMVVILGEHSRPPEVDSHMPKHVGVKKISNLLITNPLLPGKFVGQFCSVYSEHLAIQRISKLYKKSVPRQALQLSFKNICAVVLM